MAKQKMKNTQSMDARQAAAHARQWVESPEGQQALEAGLKQARTMTEQFRKAQRVAPESLTKPFTR